VKPKKVNMTDRKSWCIQAADDTIEEIDAKWVTGDGINDEDIKGAMFAWT
jgi:hypothetical protein